jgi:hypothetical protein
MVTNLALSQACEGCLLYKAATGRSRHTISDYRNSYKKLAPYFPDDPPFISITRAQLIKFFAWLQDDYITEPDGVAPRGKMRLAPKTIYNITEAADVLAVRRRGAQPRRERPAIDGAAHHL